MVREKDVEGLEEYFEWLEEWVNLAEELEEEEEKLAGEEPGERSKEVQIAKHMVEVFRVMLEVRSIEARIRETTQDPDEARKKLLNILLFEKKDLGDRLDKLKPAPYLDRINICQYKYPQGPTILENWLKVEALGFLDLIKLQEERHKIYDQLIKEKGSASSEDLPDRLKQNLKDVSDEGFELIGHHRAAKVARNYYDLKPPFVRRDVKIPEYIKKLYAESRWSYVFQNYNACVALCRAIVECVVKEKTGREKKSRIELRKDLERANRNKLISVSAVWIAEHVILPANRVLHAGQVLKKERALKVVEKTKDFLEGIYKEG